MKIYPMGTKLLHAYGRKDGNAQTLLCAIWRKYLKTVHEDVAISHQGCVTLDA